MKVKPSRHFAHKLVFYSNESVGERRMWIGRGAHSGASGVGTFANGQLYTLWIRAILVAQAVSNVGQPFASMAGGKESNDGKSVG